MHALTSIHRLLVLPNVNNPVPDIDVQLDVVGTDPWLYKQQVDSDGSATVN